MVAALDPVLPIAREPGFELRPRGATEADLFVWGTLPESWCAALCTGLARAGIEICTAWARRLEVDTWLAEFALASRRGRAHLLGIDVLELAGRRARPGPPEPLRLSRHRLTPSERLGGSLRLDLAAPDRPGFLGDVLHRLAVLSLVAEEMRITTRHDRVVDAFWLRTAQGGVPGPAHERALGEVLAGRLFV